MTKKVYSSVHIEVAFVAMPFGVRAPKHWKAELHISNAVRRSHPSAMSERNGVAKKTVISATNMLYHINAATMILQHGNKCHTPFVQPPEQPYLVLE